MRSQGYQDPGPLLLVRAEYWDCEPFMPVSSYTNPVSLLSGFGMRPGGKHPVLFLLLALVLASGCGGVAPQPNPAGGTGSGPPISNSAVSLQRVKPQPVQYFSLYPDEPRLDTNQTNRIRALYPNGDPADVVWSIVDGENRADLGQGRISNRGHYTPPPALSADTTRVEVKAALKDTPTVTATYILTITPGMVQALTPAVANLAPASHLLVTGEIAEVNAGSMDWGLAADPAGRRPLGGTFGTVQSKGCRHSPSSYTVCSATYTAPARLPAGATNLYLTARPHTGSGEPASAHILLNSGGFSSSPLDHQKVETGDIPMGVSGGNANDFDSSRGASGRQYVDACCGGTLGALVQDQEGSLYILSDNHVLAESDQAQPGDSIVQPALIDSNCNPQAGRTVGALRYSVPLNRKDTNVDAALALATPAVDPSGTILEIGRAEDGKLAAAPPAAGKGEALTAGILNRLKVVKSGRTTGLTCSTVGVIDLTIAIDYYYDCAETKPYHTKIFTRQIGVSGVDFADSGDSGALLLDQSNAQPVGMLIATGGGAGGMSIANPIRDVLHELRWKTQAAGRDFSIVGGPEHPVTCSDFDSRQSSPPGPPLTVAGKRQAEAAAATFAVQWMAPGSGILEVGTGTSLDRPGKPAVLVWVDRERSHVRVPDSIAGVRTVVIRTDRAGAEAHVPPALPERGIHLSSAALQAAGEVVQERAASLMRDPAFFGVGVAQSWDNPAEAVLLILTDMNKTPRSMPDFAGGLRVRYLTIHRLHVTRSRFRREDAPAACGLTEEGPRWSPGRMSVAP